MENAVDALKMSFSVLILLIALSITFYLFNKTKETIYTLLWYSDRENYYSYEYQDLENGREVHVDTLISTLKNFKTQASYVRIEYSPSSSEIFKISDGSSSKERINDTIKDLLNNHSNDIFYESVEEITTGGSYILAEDETKLLVDPTGAGSRRYIIYRLKP